MLLGDLVGFKSELFFEGAVQLRWVNENPERAAAAAENFVFHGPLYHGVKQDDADGISSAYKLKDTATLVLELVESFSPDSTKADPNPISLAVAGYGSGKSHFALTFAKLLMSPSELLACKIIYNIKSADEAVGEQVEQVLEKIGKPSLVVTLDGMSNFHLGSELSRGIIKQLKENNLDLAPILELSPRFTYAGDFVRRNFDIRKDDFAKLLARLDKETICTKLEENDESTYEIVDDIFYMANGTRIPVDGQESAQDMINTVCENYCGNDGFFANFIILFDEFGRYLEYAAEKPRLAGDSALQQIFQGIQDNKKLTRFVGFIQYELKTYLNRFTNKELYQLQRYITRFDSANKLYLSTNLETLFAHLIEKKDLFKLRALIQSESNKKIANETHADLCSNLPGINKYPVWNDSKQFQKVIVEGCWPLHPLTTWFLTRQQDIVQSRSALTFIKDVLDGASRQQITHEGNIFSIPPAELVLRSMLPEIVAAERAQAGVIAETLVALLEKYQARLDEPQRLVLAGIMILDKLRILTKEKAQIDRLLQLATGLNAKVLAEAFKYLSSDIGAVEWNRDLCQYELVADAATRGQFQQLLKKKLSNLDQDKIGDLFISKARLFGDLGDIDTDFALSREIYSRDWQFSAMHAHGGNYLDVVMRAFEEWKTAEEHDEAKGRVIYLYLTAKDDPNSYIEKSKIELNKLLIKHKFVVAPIWTIVIHDKDEKIADNLSRLYVLEDNFVGDEGVKFGRFIPEEKERSSRTVLDEIQTALRQRLFAVAGIDEVANQKLRSTANSIFEHIYPNVLTFPFDGFQSKGGTGPKDCAQLIKALIGRQVSGDWIATQVTAFQNRFKRLFVQVWKVMGSDGKILLKPGLKQLAELLDALEVTHTKQQDLSLFDTYNMLLGPPFGYNSSSAGLIIGLLLARETPPRALKYKNENIALQDWLGYAFPSKGGKNFLDKNCLRFTKIIFLSEDSLQRWKKIITELEYEENLRKKIALFEKANNQIKVDPIPETLEGRFQFVREKAEQAKTLIREHTKKVQDWEFEIEKAEKFTNIKNYIRVGGDIKKYLKSLEGQEAIWSAEDYDNLNKLVSEILRALNGNVSSWLEMQACNSFQMLQDFRSYLERTVRNLILLDLKDEAEEAELHKNKIISQVEKRMKFETTISSAADIVKQIVPNKSTASWKLKEEIGVCDNLLNNLKVADKEIGGSDISHLVKQIEARREEIKACMKTQKDDLKAITNAPLMTQLDIKTAKQRLTEQFQVFKGTIDEEYVGDMIKQLNTMLVDIHEWNSIVMPPEDTDKFMNDQITKRCAQLELSENEEMAVNWDFLEVYSNIRTSMVAERHAQSQKWLTTVKPNIDTIDQWSLRECAKQLSMVSDRPKFLSAAHALEIDNVEKAILMKSDEIKEKERQETALKWINNIRAQTEDLENLSLIDCSRITRHLEKVPDIISDKEINQVIELRNIIAKRQDSLDIESIFVRICELKEELRFELLAKLKKIMINI